MTTKQYLLKSMTAKDDAEQQKILDQALYEAEEREKAERLADEMDDIADRMADNMMEYNRTEGAQIEAYEKDMGGHV